MLFFLESKSLTGLLVSIPESVGLLVFGTGLIAIAVLIRWLIDRLPAEKAKRETVKKA